MIGHNHVLMDSQVSEILIVKLKKIEYKLEGLNIWDLFLGLNLAL